MILNNKNTFKKSEILSQIFFVKQNPEASNCILPHLLYGLLSKYADF